MAETTDIGRLYFHGYTYPTRKAPLFNPTSTHEVDPPYRVGRCAIVRVPCTRQAFVVGWWTARRMKSEDDALMTALGWRQPKNPGKVTEQTLFKDFHVDS